VRAFLPVAEFTGSHENHRSLPAEHSWMSSALGNTPDEATIHLGNKLGDAMRGVRDDIDRSGRGIAAV
jgi:hypothetical protein